MFIKDETEIASRVGIIYSAEKSFLASCCLSPMRRNSALEELRVSKLVLAVIQDGICCKAFWM